MTKTFPLASICLFGVLILAACNSAGGQAFPTLAPTASPPPTAVFKSLPTPQASGRAVVYGDLQVVMDQVELTTSYLNEYGSIREPSAGNRFLWVHLGIQNLSQAPQILPAPEHYSVLNTTTEYKSTYGHRRDYPDYMTLPTELVEGQNVDAWLRFDIPVALELVDLRFAYLPESSQISVGFSSSNSPWGDKPIYLWTFTP
jgi:hypothetical protein